MLRRHIRSGPLKPAPATCSAILKSHYNTVYLDTLQYSAVQCRTIQFNTVQYSTIQYNIVQYTTIQYSRVTAWVGSRAIGGGEG